MTAQAFANLAWGIAFTVCVVIPLFVFVESVNRSTRQ